jgi:hypothetical protein
VPFPTFIIGPVFSVVGWVRDRHQSRRKVKLTVHRAYKLLAFASFGGGEPITASDEFWFITVTNASRDRDIVVTHIWIETDARVDVIDRALPVRLKHSAPWETSIPMSEVPGDPERVPWLARCLLSPDDKIVKSRPRKNVPPVGTVPRG